MMGIFDYIAKRFGPKEHPVEGVFRTINELADKLTHQEIELRQSQLEWEATFHAVSDAIALINPDCTIRRANRAFCVLNGCVPEQVRGRICHEVTGCDMTQCVAKEYFNGPCKDKEKEIVLEHKGRVLNIRYSPVFRQDGTLEFLVSTARDITDRHKSREELKRQVERNDFLYNSMRSLCDNMPALVWSKDKESRFTFVNKAHADFLGAKDTDEPIGLTDMYYAMKERNNNEGDPRWWTFGELCLDSDNATLSAMRPMQFYEFGNIRGRFAYLDVRKAPFMDKDGSCQGTVGCGIDITHLHAAMSALTLEKDKVIKLFNQHYLYDLLNSVPFYIWLKDKDGKFLWVNRHHQNIGKKWELIVGKSTEEFMQMFMTHPYGYHIAQIKSEDERAKEGDITISDSERITQDGELLNLKTFRFPIVSDNGEIVAIGGVHIEMKLLGMECEK